jgi:hypothetical protein
MSALKKYYRKPKLYIELPSRLYFYPEGFIPSDEISSNNEVGVLPMTTMNDLMLKNPEALLNGTAIESLIKDSTTLNDINVKKMIKSDVDSLLVAIKIASHGDTQEVDLTCPKCKHEQTYSRDLKKILEEVEPHEKEYTVTHENLSGLIVYLQPSTFQDALTLDAHAFEEQKKITQIRQNLNKMLSEKEIEEEDEVMFLSSIHEIFKDLTMSTMEVYANCIQKIVTEEGEVEDDREEIYTWLKQLDNKSFEAIRDKLGEINAHGVTSEEKVKCVECEYEWEQPFDTNPTDFFATGS